MTVFLNSWMNFDLWLKQKNWAQRFEDNGLDCDILWFESFSKKIPKILFSNFLQKKFCMIQKGKSFQNQDTQHEKGGISVVFLLISNHKGIWIKIETILKWLAKNDNQIKTKKKSSTQFELHSSLSFVFSRIPRLVYKMIKSLIYSYYSNSGHEKFAFKINNRKLLQWSNQKKYTQIGKKWSIKVVPTFAAKNLSIEGQIPFIKSAEMNWSR